MLDNEMNTGSEQQSQDMSVQSTGGNGLQKAVMRQLMKAKQKTVEDDTQEVLQEPEFVEEGSLVELVPCEQEEQGEEDTEKTPRPTAKINYVKAVVGEKNEEIENLQKTEEDSSVEQIEKVVVVKAESRPVLNVNAEDLLVTRIDEFREKAMELQGMYEEKKNKMVQLDALMAQQQERANSLKGIPVDSRESAKEISKEVGKQISKLMDQVSTRMDQVESNLYAEVVKGGELDSNSVRQLDEISEKQLKMLNEFGEKQSKQIESKLLQLTEQLAPLSKGFDKISEEIEDINDKIHSEQVKSYRNTADLFKEMDDRLDKMDDIEENVRNVQKFTFCTVVISAVGVALSLGILIAVLFF